MRYQARDIPDLLRSSLGRHQFALRSYQFAWPVLAPIAHCYRASLVRRTRVVAVVGSLGKTTTTRAVRAALFGTAQPSSRGNTMSFIAQGVFGISPGDRHAVLEVSVSGPGQMDRYVRLLRPDVTVVASIASEHNRSFGNLEATRDEKVKMVRGLALSAGLAVLNGDDPHVRWMATQTRAKVVTFGFGEASDVRATDFALDWPHGSRFTLDIAGEKRQVRSKLLGRHQVYSILAAAAVAVAEGLELEAVLPFLEQLEPGEGRLQVMQLQSGALVLRDEFKSTLETIDAALDVLAEIPARRKVVVLGDVSEPPSSPRPIYRRLGRRLAGIADRAVFVGRMSQSYAAGAKEAGMPREALVNAGHDLPGAVEAVAQELGPGDVVLIKGRDTQRLDRVALALAGRAVRCQIKFCDAAIVRCECCPMLERGWDGLRVII